MGAPKTMNPAPTIATAIPNQPWRAITAPLASTSQTAMMAGMATANNVASVAVAQCTPRFSSAK